MSRRWFYKKRYVLPAAIIGLIFLLPNRWTIPVADASQNDWHQETFWYEPWGSSVTHKGIDIFGAKDTEVVAANDGVLLYAGELKKGGQVVVLLGPEWKIHYYAHLDSIAERRLIYFSGDKVGTLGDSGNAKGKQPHLHFSIVSIFPYFWKADTSTQGWKKMFYLNPIHYLTET